MDSQTLNAWPNCAVPDCPNKACLRLNSTRCYPHTIGKPLNFLDRLTEQKRTSRLNGPFEAALAADLGRNDG